MTKLQKDLHDKIIVLFLLMLKYSNKISPVLSLFKTDRNLIKSNICDIYSKYTTNDELKMTTTEIRVEIKKLEPVFKQIGKELALKENNVLTPLLYIVFHDTYYRTNYELSKGLKLDVKKLTNNIISQSVNLKVLGKTTFDRNKDNKAKFINKTNNDIEDQLTKGVSIDTMNKSIDKNFNTGAFYSQRLAEDQVTRAFHEAQKLAYINAGIDKVIFTAVVDERTTDLCLGLDQEVFDIEDAPEPPLHLYCRSTLLPIVTDWNETTGNKDTYSKFMQENDI